MSNSLITDSFPKVKKEKLVIKNYRQTKLQTHALPDTSHKDAIDDKKEQELGCLKAFDLELEYGPCIGITRLERWERAENYGLHPPQEVKDIIEQHLGDSLYTECLWHDANL